MTSKTWWGEQFIEALSSFIAESRLQRGSAYKTDARISDFKQNLNKITATMKGNKNLYFGITEVPYYKTEIEFKELPDKVSLIAGIADDPLALAKLVTRELPASIAQILPQNSKDMSTKCSCPDWENPCKHVAGLYLRLAEEIDKNPLMIFELRGIEQKELTEKIQTLIQVPLSSDNDTKVKLAQPPQDIKMREFWGVPRQLKMIDQPATIPCILIKKAGVNPPFWHKRKSFIEVMDLIYKAARKKWNTKV